MGMTICLHLVQIEDFSISVIVLQNYSLFQHSRPWKVLSWRYSLFLSLSSQGRKSRRALISESPWEKYIASVALSSQPPGGNGSSGSGAPLSFRWRIIDSVGGCCYWGIKSSSPLERASARVRVWKGAGNSEAIHNLLSSAGLGEARFQGLSGCLLRGSGKQARGRPRAKARLCPVRERADLRLSWEADGNFTWSCSSSCRPLHCFGRKISYLDVATWSPCRRCLCLGNLYASTCKHVHCSLPFAPQCCVARRVISHYADSIDSACLSRGVWPRCRMRSQGEERGSPPGEFWRVAPGWCCGPARVNDFLKWRPGPTLCGNQQSRSQNAQREEGAEDASCREKPRSGGTLLCLRRLSWHFAHDCI